jgi:hypothetical protein
MIYHTYRISAFPYTIRHKHGKVIIKYACFVRFDGENLMFKLDPTMKSNDSFFVHDKKRGHIKYIVLQKKFFKDFFEILKATGVNIKPYMGFHDFSNIVASAETDLTMNIAVEESLFEEYQPESPTVHVCGPFDGHSKTKQFAISEWAKKADASWRARDNAIAMHVLENTHLYTDVCW